MEFIKFHLIQSVASWLMVATWLVVALFCGIASVLVSKVT